MVQIRRKGPKRSEHVGMQKGANFTIVSTMVLIGLNIKFYEIFAKQHVYYSQTRSSVPVANGLMNSLTEE